MLHAAPVDRPHRELRQLDAVDAADIECHHLAAIGLLAAGKHLDAAVGAHLVADGVLVEEIFLQAVLAGIKTKPRRVEKGEMQPLLGAGEDSLKEYLFNK